MFKEFVSITQMFTNGGNFTPSQSNYQSVIKNKILMHFFINTKQKVKSIDCCFGFLSRFTHAYCVNYSGWCSYNPGKVSICRLLLFNTHQMGSTMISFEKMNKNVSSYISVITIFWGNIYNLSNAL